MPILVGVFVFSAAFTVSRSPTLREPCFRFLPCQAVPLDLPNHYNWVELSEQGLQILEVASLEFEPWPPDDIKVTT